MHFKGKLIIQVQEKCEKPHSGPDLGPLGPNSDLEFFFKTLASTVNIYHGQLSPFTLSEKTNYPILRRFTDGRTDGRTDRRKGRRTRVIS